MRTFEEHVFLACRSFLSEYYGAELPLFDVVWPAAVAYLRETQPGREAFSLTLGPGAVSPEDSPVHAALGVFSAVLARYPPDAAPATDRELAGVVRHAAGRLGLSGELCDRLVSAAVAFYRCASAPLESAGPVRDADGPSGASVAVYVRGRRHIARPGRLARLRAMKEKVDVWADETVPELLVRGKRTVLRPGESESYRLLVGLMQHAGSTWSHSDAYRACTGRYPESGDGRVSTLVRSKLAYLRRNLRLAGLSATAIDGWLPKASTHRAIVVKRNLRTALVMAR